MRIALGEASARCRSCGHERFEPLPVSGAMIRDRRFACLACGHEHDYGELVRQIDETSRPSGEQD
jgi:hypothetical protein